MTLGDAFAATIIGVFGILWFRALPVVGFVVLTKQLGLGRKVLVAAAFAALTLSLRVWRLSPLAPLFLAYGWFIACSMIVPLGGRLLHEAVVTRGGLFAASASAFFVLPALLLPTGSKATVLVLGWDLMLSAYSFCVESAVGGEVPSRADCLFFLLVNPSLVYTRRGERIGPPGLSLRGALRAAIGLAMMAAAIGALAPAHEYVRAHARATPVLRGAIVSVFAFGA